MTIKQLAKVIKSNPGCIAVIDNDTWKLLKRPATENPHNDGDPDKADQWDAKNRIADCSECEADEEPDQFGSCCYGGHVLEALALIVGIKVESV